MNNDRFPALRRVFLPARGLTPLILVVCAGCSDAHTHSANSGGGSLPETAQHDIQLPIDVRESSIKLIDVTRETQITFCHTDGNCGKYYIVESNSSGLATFDYDNDGRVDIYFLSGVPLRGAPADAPPGGNVLYRNLGGFRFEDVTQRAGVGQAGYGMGVTAGDYNNDGHQDLYVSNFGPKVLYRNNADGTFTDVSQEAGVTNGSQLGAGASFLDFDDDSHLDLYVANYVDFSYETPMSRTMFGVPVYPGPLEYLPAPHSLYHNRGDGTFEDVSQASGIGERAGAGMGTICADYDNDGDSDILVANDHAANFCFRNDGAGKFTEVGVLAGLAYNVDGLVVGNMGIDCTDYDHDGWLDFFVTTYQREFPILFHNQGGGVLRDVTATASETGACFNNSKWGCGFADFDNDGYKDILVGIGHLQVNIEQYDKTSAYAARPMLLRNNGEGKFEDVTDSSGDGLQVLCVARGVALEDLDNDGRIDVVISNSRRAPLILKNESQTTHHWLELRLRGTKVNRDAVGARVKVTAGDLVQIDELQSGRGYQSHFGTRLHFGLGVQSHVDSIEVRWPGGFREAWEHVEPDQFLTLTEGSGAATDFDPEPPTGKSK